MVREPPAELFQFMTPYPAFVLDIMLAARERVLAAAPEATEILYDATYTVVLGYSFTHSHVQGFIHLPAYAKHVNLGFDYGVDLDDPGGRLVGSGTRVRHISLRTVEDVADPYLSGLIEAAARNAMRPPAPLEATQIVKVMEGAKRRPL